MSVPPEPVLPPSDVVMVSVTAPLALRAGANTGAEPPARKLLMLARVPVNVIDPEFEPATVTPPALVAVRRPELTSSVTVIVPDAASTSEIERPVSMTEVSSLVV